MPEGFGPILFGRAPPSVTEVVVSQLFSWSM
jgi:hypothetical protein